MKHVFIVNPVSGKADASGVVVPRIIAAAGRAGIDYTIELTSAPRHAIRLAEQYASGGEEVRLYSCGGDGTLNEVLTGAWTHPNAQVACIPCGSGNDFVKNFGTQEDFLDLDDMIRGVPVSIDLMRTSEGISAAICSAGLDAQVAYGIPKFRRVPLCGGAMAYNLSILENLCSHLGRKMEIIVDDEVFEEECLLAAVCNGKAYGGGFMAAPEARMDDGLLDVVIVRKISRLRIASLMSTFKKGGHFQDGEVLAACREIVLFRRGRKVSLHPTDGAPLVVNVDGECSKQSGLEAEVMPGAARIVLPGRLAPLKTV